MLMTNSSAARPSRKRGSAEIPMVERHFLRRQQPPFLAVSKRHQRYLCSLRSKFLRWRYSGNIIAKRDDGLVIGIRHHNILTVSPRQCRRVAAYIDLWAVTTLPFPR